MRGVFLLVGLYLRNPWFVCELWIFRGLSLVDVAAACWWFRVSSLQARARRGLGDLQKHSA